LDINEKVIVTLREFRNSIKNGEIPIEGEDFFRKVSLLDKKFKREPCYELNVNGFLVDLGWDFRQEKWISFALERLLKYKETVKDNYKLNKINYDIGNAYYWIASLKNRVKYRGFLTGLKKKEKESYDRDKIQTSILLEIDEYSKARRYYNKVFLKTENFYFRAKTNSTNILDTFGRYYESVYLYDHVLQYDSRFGMALGNKANAILYYYYLLPKKYKIPQLLINARDLLEKALEDDRVKNIGGEEAIEGFRNSSEGLNTIIEENNIKILNKSKEKLNKYQRFVLDSNLYLNYHFGFFINEQSLKDNLTPPFLSKRLNESTNENLANYCGFDENIFCSIKQLNQIVEDFVSARYLYYLIICGNLGRVSPDMTEYIYTNDYTRNKLEYGILKTIYTKLFNILDKVANFIFTYYDIHNSEDVYFHNLTDERFKCLVKNKGNRQVLALYSLSMDFQAGYQYNYLKGIRNSITHEYLDIDEMGVNFKDNESKKRIYKENFISDIQLLFEITKSAILYSVLPLEKEFEKVGNADRSKIGMIRILKQSEIYKDLDDDYEKG